MFFQYFLVLIGASSLLIDIYRNSQTFYNLVGIRSGLFAFFILFILFLKRAVAGYHTSPLLQKLLCFTFILTFLAGGVMSAVEYLNYPNYVYSLLHLNYDMVSKLSLYFFALYLLGLNNNYYKVNYRTLIPLLTLAALLYLVIARTWPNDFFLHLVKEDNFIEYSQFFALLFCSYFALVLAKGYRKINKIKSLFFSMLFIFLVFTAGDEISWGQRIVGIHTPESVALANRQGEITVHNLRIIPEVAIWFAYLLANTYGTFSHLLVKSRWLWSELIVPRFASVSFLIAFLYSAVSYPQETRLLSEWSEPAELFMYLGVTYYLLYLYIDYKKAQNSTKTSI